MAPKLSERLPVGALEGVREPFVASHPGRGLDVHPDPDLAGFDRRVIAVLDDRDAAQGAVRKASLDR
jgi:hypothetical protein